MAFADNLRQLRKERGLSQEALAELMDVSRQAVSKWEQGEGYPEVEKLLLLSGKLDVSLDRLMAQERIQSSASGPATGTILITSPHENVVASCYKIMSSQKMHGGKRAPQYALYGVSGGITSFWGEATTFLGWYANQEALAKEVDEIFGALQAGVQSYTLQYSVKVARKWLGLTMTEE